MGSLQFEPLWANKLRIRLELGQCGLYAPELCPTEVWATSMGTTSGMARIAGTLAPILGGWLLPISLVVALTLYAVSFVVGGLVVFLLGQETKGQPLAETIPN